MKVAHIGGIANNDFIICKYLRKLGVEADVFTHDAKTFGSQIVNAKKYPWVKFYKKSFLGYIKLFFELQKYDLIHAHTGAIMFTQFFGRPMVAHTMGSDSRIVAFKKDIEGYFMRRAYVNNKVIYSLPVFLETMQDLGVKDHVAIPLLLDIPDYIPKFTKKKEGLVFFNPCRQLWSVKYIDKCLKAFAKFTKKHNAELRLIEMGPDLEKTKKLIKKLNLEDKITWLPWLSNKKLIQETKNADVVIILGPDLSLSAKETMALARPLIDYYPKEQYTKEWGGNPPILWTKLDVNSIVKVMEKSLDPKYRKEIALKSRKWIAGNHGLNAAKKYLDVYKEIINGK